MNSIGMNLMGRLGDASTGEGLTDKRVNASASANFAGDLARCMQPGCFTAAPMAEPAVNPLAHVAPSRGRSAQESAHSQELVNARPETGAENTATGIESSEERWSPHPATDGESSDSQNAAAMLVFIQDATWPLLAQSDANFAVINATGMESGLTVPDRIGVSSLTGGPLSGSPSVHASQMPPLQSGEGAPFDLSTGAHPVGLPPPGVPGLEAGRQPAMGTPLTKTQDLAGMSSRGYGPLANQPAVDPMSSSMSTLNPAYRLVSAPVVGMAPLLSVAEIPAQFSSLDLTTAPTAQAIATSLQVANPLYANGRPGMPGLMGVSLQASVGSTRWTAGGLGAARNESPVVGGEADLEAPWPILGSQGLSPAAAATFQPVTLVSGLVPVEVSWMRSLKDLTAGQAAASPPGELVSAWLGDAQAPASQAGMSPNTGHAPGIPSEAFARQVAAQVQTWVGASLRSADISLNAQQADAMQVRIELQGQDVSIHFRTDAVATREAMAQQVDRLQVLLQAQGLNLADTSFDAFGGQAREQSGSRFTSTEVVARMSESSSSRSAAPTLPRPGPAHGGRVGALDVFV